MSSCNPTQASLSPRRILFIYFYLILFIQTSERKKSLTGSPGVDDFRTSDPFIRSHSLPVAARGFPMCCAVFRLAIPGLGEMQPAAPGSHTAHLTPQEKECCPRILKMSCAWLSPWVGFPGGSEDKESAYNAGDWGLMPGWGRSPGGGNGYSLQYSCPGNPEDRGAWWAAVHGVPKSRTWLCDSRFLSLNMLISFLLDHMAIFFLKLGLASINPHVQRARKKRFSQRDRKHRHQGNKSERRHGNIPAGSGQP